MSHCHTILARLRQRGYRITPQRELIIEALVHSSRHITAEGLHARVLEQTSAVNIATVYRTLDMLINEGFVIRAGLIEGQMSYAPKVHGTHFHLVCRYCQQSLDADGSLLFELSRQISDRYHFTADAHHLILLGVCRACEIEHAVIFEEDN